MSVAIHPSETRPNAGPPRAGRGRLRLVAGIVLGGTALAGFTVGAFSFFSGLADPRVRPVAVAPVASQWPDLKDGVPALAEGASAAPTRLSLPPAEPPTQRAETTPAPPAPIPPARVEPARAEIARPAVAKVEAPKIEAPKIEASRIDAPAPKAEPVRTAASGRPNLPIEPASTLAPARTAAPVAPAKVAAVLAPARAETVRAKDEQPARFVSLPAKAETPKAEARKADASKAEAKATPRPEKAEKAEAARKPAARTRVTTAEATPAASAPAPVAAADDEPELLGMKIPGGRQIRDGWNATVGGLMGKKDGE